jgi:hypothetical protein
MDAGPNGKQRPVPLHSPVSSAKRVQTQLLTLTLSGSVS